MKLSLELKACLFVSDQPVNMHFLSVYLCAAGFHEWWSAGALRQNLVNCSGCAEISSVLEVPESLRGTVTLRRGPQLVLLKVRGQRSHGGHLKSLVSYS